MCSAAPNTRGGAWLVGNEVQTSCNEVQEVWKQISLDHISIPFLFRGRHFHALRDHPKAYKVPPPPPLDFPLCRVKPDVRQANFDSSHFQTPDPRP